MADSSVLYEVQEVDCHRFDAPLIAGADRAGKGTFLPLVVCVCCTFSNLQMLTDERSMI